MTKTVAEFNVNNPCYLTLLIQSTNNFTQVPLEYVIVPGCLSSLSSKTIYEKKITTIKRGGGGSRDGGRRSWVRDEEKKRWRKRAREREREANRES